MRLTNTKPQLHVVYSAKSCKSSEKKEKEKEKNRERVRMGYAALSLLLDTLRDLQREHMKQIRGVEGELKQLQKQVERLTAFLHDQQQRQQKKTTTTGEEWKQFDREIRDLVYKAEDIIDTFLSRKLRRFSPKNRNLNLRPVIDGIRNALEHAPSDVSEWPVIEHHRKASKEMNVVGLEDELPTILRYVKEESKELDVISVVGDSGTGKTTLASRIYEDHTIKSTFLTLVWVTVSDDFSIRDLFISVIKDFDQKTMSQLTDSMLADIVRNKLDKTKFLMLVDGVHTMEDWRAIESALPKSNKFGKLILTTHDEKLARQANPKRDPHKLRSLNIDESMELFQLEIFGNCGKFPPNIAIKVKTEIVSKCEGIPGAIVAMAGRLLDPTNCEIDKTEKFSKIVEEYLNEYQEKLKGDIIEKSYNKLPHHLRDCFLYVGMFPEDTAIPGWKLVRLWIAEGFIQNNPSKTLEQVAEEHLEDLIDRKLVMVDKTKVEGGIKTCSISKRIREFCKSHAAFREQNLFQEVDSGDFEIAKCRRLCVHSDVVDILCKSSKGGVVRSLLCFSKESINSPGECIPEAFTLLRVLDASPIKFLGFPRMLARIIHLRYIAISTDHFKSLPRGFSNFWNLQTIIINTPLPTFQFEANIWKMMKLRHLKTKAAIVINMVARGKFGENLQTFSRLAVECVTRDFCSSAYNLKKLGIRGNLNKLLEKDCLSGLDRLKKLKLVHDGKASEDPLIRLPPREAFPPNLMILELSSTHLKWEHTTTLAELPVLEVLKLKRNAFVGKEWNADGGRFLYLQVLLIDTSDLEVWKVFDDPFPALRNLVVKNCAKLQEIPSKLLKSVPVVDTDTRLADERMEATDIEPLQNYFRWKRHNEYAESISDRIGKPHSEEDIDFVVSIGKDDSPDTKSDKLKGVEIVEIDTRTESLTMEAKQHMQGRLGDQS